MRKDTTVPGTWAHVQLVGHLGQDPEGTFLPNGDVRTTFTMATQNRPTASGEESATWWRITAFAKLAEICSQYLHKGSFVLIAGSVELRSFTKKDGTPGSALEVRASDMRMLDRRSDAEGMGNAPLRGAAAAAGAAALEPDDQVPFHHKEEEVTWQLDF